MARADDPTEIKAVWRRRVLAARRALGEDARAARDAALCVAAAELASGTVCAYVPVGGEPGGSAFVDALTAAGATVLLPVVPAEAGPLDWARHDGRFAAGPLGLRQPVGPRLGPSVVTEAALVLVPALAVDRRGVRLGRGGGYYDRTLALTGAPAVAVLGEGEVVDELPAEPHDRPVAAALLPAGLIMLGKTR